MLAASLVFYVHFAGLGGLAIITGLSAYTYAAGWFIHRQQVSGSGSSGWRLAFATTPAILALLYFHYYGFLTGQWELVTGGVSACWPASA